MSARALTLAAWPAMACAVLASGALAQPAGSPAPAATPTWPQQQSYHLDKPLPQFAIKPERADPGSTKGTNTKVTVTALRRAPMPSDKIEAPETKAFSRFLPHPDVALNPLQPNSCTDAYSNVGGQPASGTDIAGAVGREGCPP